MHDGMRWWRGAGSRRSGLRAGAALLAGAALACGAQAAAPQPQAPQPLRLHGVQLPAGQAQDGQSLLRNGAGTRRILFFKIYVAALYLPQPTRDASAALAMPGPKEMRLVMLRDVSGKELSEHMESDLRNNLSPQRLDALKPELERMRGWFEARGELHSGDVVELIRQPGRGVLVEVDGRSLGPALDDRGLFESLLRVWLGAKPAESRLKRALLGDDTAAD